MTHPRKTLRGALKARLAGVELNGLTLTPVTNRTKDLEATKLPIAAIVTEEETSERASKSGAIDRRVQVFIVLVIEVEDAKALDDDCDAWAELVEDRLKQVPVGGARCMTLRSTSLDLPPPEEGETWIAYLALEYEAEIFGE